MSVKCLRISITDRCNLQCVYCRPLHDCNFIEHQDILAFGQQFFNVGRGSDTLLQDLSSIITTAALAAPIFVHPAGNNLAVRLYIIDIEEAGAFQPHVYKGCLHAGQYPDDTAPVDVADHAFFLRPFQVEFHQVAMLDQGNADFI